MYKILEEQIKKDKINLIWFLKITLEIGLNFDFRSIINWDNTIQSQESPLEPNKNIRPVNIPSTLVVFAKDSEKHNIGDMQTYIISKAYVPADDVFSVFSSNGYSFLTRRCEQYDFKNVNVVMVNPYTKDNLNPRAEGRGVCKENPKIIISYINSVTFFKSHLDLINDKNTLFIFFSIP